MDAKWSKASVRPMDLNFRQLRHFVAVCEHGSIAAAARYLHIAQPALSRQMSMLEDDFGVALFDRVARGVILTRAGQVLLDKSKGLTCDLNSMVAEVRDADAGNSGALKIGVVHNYSWLPIFRLLLADIRASSSRVDVSIETYLSQYQNKLIVLGELDAGFVAWRPINDSILSGIPVLEERFVIAVPKQVEEKYGNKCCIEALATETFVMFDRVSAPQHFDAIVNVFSKSGFAPRIVQSAAEHSTVMGLVESGLGCGVVPSSYAKHASANVSFLPLGSETVPFTVEFVWKTSNRDPLLLRAVEFIRQNAKTDLQ